MVCMSFYLKYIKFINNECTLTDLKGHQWRAEYGNNTMLRM